MVALSKFLNSTSGHVDQRGPCSGMMQYGGVLKRSGPHAEETWVLRLRLIILNPQP